jgi:hypothetical protein
MIEDAANDTGWSPQKGDRRTAAGGSGNSDSHREELTHAKVGSHPVIFSTLARVGCSE